MFVNDAGRNSNCSDAFEEIIEQIIIEQIFMQIIIEQLFEIIIEQIIIEQIFEQIIIEQLFEQIIVEQLFEVIIEQIFGPIKTIITISADHNNNDHLSGARRADFGHVLVIYWSLLQYNNNNEVKLIMY